MALGKSRQAHQRTIMHSNTRQALNASTRSVYAKWYWVNHGRLTSPANAKLTFRYPSSLINRSTLLLERSSAKLLVFCASSRSRRAVEVIICSVRNYRSPSRHWRLTFRVGDDQLATWSPKKKKKKKKEKGNLIEQSRIFRKEGGQIGSEHSFFHSSASVRSRTRHALRNSHLSRACEALQRCVFTFQPLLCPRVWWRDLKDTIPARFFRKRRRADRQHEVPSV